MRRIFCISCKVRLKKRANLTFLTLQLFHSFQNKKLHFVLIFLKVTFFKEKRALKCLHTSLIICESGGINTYI